MALWWRDGVLRGAYLFNRGSVGDWEIVATLKQRWRCCRFYNETEVVMSQCIFVLRGGKVLHCATLEDFLTVVGTGVANVKRFFYRALRRWGATEPVRVHVCVCA